MAIADLVELRVADDARANVFQQPEDSQSAFTEAPGERFEARVRVYGAQRMIPVFGARDDQVGVARKANQVRRERVRYIRHVAGEDEHGVPARFRQRRMNSAERTGPGHEVADRSGRWMRRTPDEQNLVYALDSAKHRDLVLKDGLAIDQERAFVAAAEPPRASTAQYRCAPHPATILPHPAPGSSTPHPAPSTRHTKS